MSLIAGYGYKLVYTNGISRYYGPSTPSRPAPALVEAERCAVVGGCTIAQTQFHFAESMLEEMGARINRGGKAIAPSAVTDADILPNIAKPDS